MKYRAVVMVPTIVEFENPGSYIHVANQAHALCNGLPRVTMGEEVYDPRLLCVHFENVIDEQPLYFDPPPQVA